MAIENNIDSSDSIIDTSIKIGDYLKKQSELLYNQAIEKTIKEAEDKTPLVAYSLISLFITNKQNKITNNLNKKYDSFIEELTKSLDNQYNISLSQADFNVIKQQKKILLDEIIDNTNILKRNIKKTLLSNLGKKITKTQLVKRLRELYPAYSNNAETIINTTLARQYTAISVAKFKQENYNWYLYSGPKDSKNRAECGHFVNHKYSSSQLDELTSYRLGFWNCRHVLVPLTDSEAEKYPQGNFNY